MAHKKLKVLLTIPNFDTAGSGKVVYDLVVGIKEHCEVEIACNHNRGIFFAQVEKLGVPIHLTSFTTPYRPYSTLFFRIRKLALFFKKNRYDVIHSWHWSSDWTEPLAARLAGIPWLYTKKAMSWGNVHWKIRSFLANFIVTINDEMVSFFPSRKAQQLIPLGIDVEYYKPRKSERDSSRFRIISVANLVPVKGIEVLIRAVNVLANKYVQLIIVGDDRDPYAKELKLLASELEKKSEITFLPKQTDIRALVGSADLFVIPTLNAGRREGMPMALVEAMCLGVPVLGSAVSGINYVLKDFPDLLFEAGNQQELAEKIKSMMILDPDERAEIGIGLSEYCKKNFSMKGFIDAHVKLYNTLAKGVN